MREFRKSLVDSLFFMFEDEEYRRKISTGAIFVFLSCSLIAIPFLLGYMLALVRRCSEGNPVPLPDWDNLGHKFMAGMTFFMILLIYWIPGIIIMFIPGAGFVLYIIYGFCLVVVLPYITVRFARTEYFADAFALTGIIEFVSRNLGNLLMVFVMTIVLLVIAQFGILALLIGIVFTYFWALLGISYLYGRVVHTAERVE